MALLDISFKSQSIALMTRMIVIVPDSGPGPWPVFYLLHGLSDDCTAWTRRTALERYVGGASAGGKGDPLPMIVAMPETARFWYANSASHPESGRIGMYEDHLIKDVIPFIDRVLPTIPCREGRAIGGLSMGGYGAVRLGFKFPDLFASITSHSGAVLTPLHRWEDRPADARNLKTEYESIFGQNWRGTDYDPAALAKKIPAENRPALRLDCGTDDFLIEHNRDFHALLNQINFPHEYAEFPGEHNWTYWDTHLPQALTFHQKHLRPLVP